MNDDPILMKDNHIEIEENVAEKIMRSGEVMIKIAAILSPLSRESQIRVIRTAAIFYGFELENFRG